MASIVKDPRRGTWSIQWWNGVKWDRVVVMKRRPGWKPGMPMPKKAPPEVQARLAEYQAKEAVARSRVGYDPAITVETFLGAFLDGYEVGREEGSKGELEKAVAVFLAWCRETKVVRLDAVTPEVCQRWMDARSRTTSKRTGDLIAYATLKKERALLASAWSEGLKRKSILVNPWVAVEVPGKGTKKRRGSWSPEEYEKILAVSRAWLRDLIVLGCHTGLRIEALRGVEWRDVHWGEAEGPGFGFLEVRPELDKAHKGYIVPIHPKVHDLLARRLVHKPSGVETIVTGMQGRPLLTSNTTDRAIVAACKRAGLKRPDSPNHHMRRTFGRWAILGHLTGKPVPMYVVSRWMGHSSITMTEQYLDMKRDDSTAWMLGSDDTGEKMPGEHAGQKSTS